MPIVLLLLALPRAFGESFPHYSVDMLCDKAELIVEGTYQGNNNVRVEAVLKASPRWEPQEQVIEVAQLDEHSRELFSGFQNTGKQITTDRLVLFLEFDERHEQWRSIATIGEDNLVGSCGLFWVEGGHCFGYSQLMNPGPFALVDQDGPFSRVPESYDALLQQVEVGLANSTEWQRSLAIEDRTERAEALARYLLQSTAPEGDQGSYMFAVRRPLAQLGIVAVPAVLSALDASEDDDRLNTLALVIYDIGPPAIEAVPKLRELLHEADRQVAKYYLLVAMASTGDPSVEADIQNYTDGEHGVPASEAREALDLLRKRIRKSLD